MAGPGDIEGEYTRTPQDPGADEWEDRGMAEVPSSLQSELQQEIAQGEDPNHPLRVWLAGIRSSVASRPIANVAYRSLVAVLGTVVVLVGIVLIPLPGPGWLVVFLGLAVLGTEFHWARRLTAFAKRQLGKFWARWNAWRAKRARRKLIRRRAKRVRKLG